MTTDPAAPTFDLATRVHALVAQYVYRAEARSGIARESFRDAYVIDSAGRRRLQVPDKYREAHEKVCNDIFLAMRSRRSREEFVAYFTGTICAVPQFLPRAEYAEFAATLLDDTRWEDVKSLAMLALAALARL